MDIEELQGSLDFVENDAVLTVVLATSCRGCSGTCCTGVGNESCTCEEEE